MILVVDDDPSIRGFIREALAMYGYHVVTVAEGLAAEQLIQRLGPHSIDLVISDVHLTSTPEAQDGYSLYQRCTTTYPTVPFLLISGDPDSCILPAVVDGSVRLLTKPFSINELLAAVGCLLGT